MAHNCEDSLIFNLHTVYSNCYFPKIHKCFKCVDEFAFIFLKPFTDPPPQHAVSDDKRVYRYTNIFGFGHDSNNHNE